MAKELLRIDISDRPDLIQLVQQAQRTNESVVLRQDSEDVAILRPVKRSSRRRRPRGKPFTLTDPLWTIVGMAHSEGSGDVAENKYKYLAEAYAPKDP